MSRKYRLQKHLAVAVLCIIRPWYTGKKYMLSAGKIIRHIFQFIFQPQQVNDFVQKLLIHRVPVQFHRQDDVLIHIQNGNKVIVLEDKTDVAAAEDGELFIVLLCQFFAPDDHGSAGGSVQPAHHVKQGGLCLLYTSTRFVYINEMVINKKIRSGIAILY